MGLGEGRGLHWVAHPLHHTKFPWFEIFVCLFPCFMFLFVCVCVFVCLVCLFLLLCISIILSEQVNDFAFSGIFEVEESHKELSICPRHRDDFGTRWLCNKKKMLLSIGLGSTWEVFSERWSRHDSATVSKALCFNIYASVPVGVTWVKIRKAEHWGRLRNQSISTKTKRIISMKSSNLARRLVTKKIHPKLRVICVVLKMKTESVDLLLASFYHHSR